MKLCIIASAGGHLQELLNLNSVFQKYDRYYITFHSPMLDKLVINDILYFIEDASQGILKLVKNIIKSFIILLKEDPDVIISSGAGMCVPTILLGWLFKKNIVHIELPCQIHQLTKTGILVKSISNLFIVQNTLLLSKYPKVTYATSLDIYKRLKEL